VTRKAGSPGRPRKRARARLRWIPEEEGGRKKPPKEQEYSTVARLAGQEDWQTKAWSMVLEFLEEEDAEAKTLAKVRFLSDDGPHERLEPGLKFDLYERPRLVANGEVIAGSTDEPDESPELDRCRGSASLEEKG
jgi:hypothetical protein